MVYTLKHYDIIMIHYQFVQYNGDGQRMGHGLHPACEPF